MRTWLALLVAPVLALADQSIAFSMATWMCNRQHMLPMHALHASFAAAILVATATAWSHWRRSAAAADPSTERRHFIAGVATASGALSALAVVAMWIPTWLLSPCFA